MSMDLIDLGGRACLLLALAWLAAAILRRTSASFRALIWTSALAALLPLPALAWMLPDWRVTVPGLQSSPVVVEQTADTSTDALANEPLALSVTLQPIAPIASEFAAAQVPDPRVSFTTTQTAVLVWAAVSILLLFRLGMSHRHLARLALSGAETDRRWFATIDTARTALGVRRPVTARISSGVSVPAVWGLFRPTLLLPPDANDWTADVRKAVALHELAHVGRADFIGQLIGQLACACYWWVPLTWIGARRAAILRECACDDAVLRAGVKATSYADSLVRIARAARPSSPEPALLAMARRSGLRARVVAILNPATTRTTPGPRARAVIATAAGLVVGALAAATPVAATPVTSRATTPDVTSSAVAMTATPSASAGIVVPPTHKPRAAQPSIDVLPAQTPARPCAGSLDQNSTSISSDDSRRSVVMTLSGRDCSVDLRMLGKVVFTDDFTDIRSLDQDGYFRLDVTERGVRRQLELEMRGGTLARQWRVDGREQPYDAEARTWFSEFLVVLDRRTAIGLEVRLPLLLRQGGVDAVLADTAQMTSDYVRTRYYAALAAARQLSPAESARVLRQGASLTKSDYYASELLKAFAPRGLQDASTRAAVIELIERLRSDYYKSETVAAFLSVGRPSAQETDFLLRMVPAIESDHYKLETLKRALAGTTLTRAQMDALIGAASSIKSDYYRAGYLKALLDAGALEGATAVIALIDGMQSDHYQAESFAELLQTRGIGERDLIAITSAAGKLSDHYASQTLRAVARHSAANERVRAAILAEADGLSRHYADEVRRSVR